MIINTINQYSYSSAENDLEFKEALSQSDILLPDVRFVGMTAPKQEKWSHTNKQALNATIICLIIAVFDFYASTMKRPNKTWINLGLEW